MRRLLAAAAASAALLAVGVTASPAQAAEVNAWTRCEFEPEDVNLLGTTVFRDCYELYGRPFDGIDRNTALINVEGFYHQFTYTCLLARAYPTSPDSPSYTVEATGCLPVELPRLPTLPVGGG